MAVKSIVTTRDYGPMTTNPKFYPPEMTEQQRILDFQERRAQLARNCGFDWRRMYVLSQSSDPNLQTPGKFDDKLGEYLKDIIATNPDQDLWLLPDRYGDIAFLDGNTTGIVIGYPTADCPVIQMATYNGDIAISHCGGAEINRGLPAIALDSFLTKTGVNKDKMMVSTGPFAQGRYVYDKRPSWATDSNVWEDCIIEKDGFFYINMRRALLKQIDPSLRGHFHMSVEDTITNPNYYSHNAATRSINPDPEKAGRQFVGLYNQGKILTLDLVKQWISTDKDEELREEYEHQLEAEQQEQDRGFQRVKHGLGMRRGR